MLQSSHFSAIIAQFAMSHMTHILMIARWKYNSKEKLPEEQLPEIISEKRRQLFHIDA